MLQHKGVCVIKGGVMSNPSQNGSEQEQVVQNISILEDEPLRVNVEEAYSKMRGAYKRRMEENGFCRKRKPKTGIMLR